MKTLYERDMEDSLRQIAEALGVTFDGIPDVEKVISAAKEAVTDTKRLAWRYQSNKTGSSAMVDAEMRLLNGESLTLEEARAAIDEAMRTPFNW